MTKKNIDDLTEEELKEALQEDDDDLVADFEGEHIDSSNAVIYKDEEEKIELSTVSDPNFNKSTVKAEIEVLSLKEQKKQERARAVEEKRFLKAKERMTKKHRRNIAKNPEKLIRYETDPEQGLSTEIVEKRVLDNLVNDCKVKTSKSIPKIIFSNIFTFFNILCLTIAGILISIQAFSDLVFLAIVTANITIGIIQEIRAKKTIDRLSLISAPTAIVKRAGVIREIAVTEVVLDDLLLLENGKQICADSIVVDGQVEVNESLLTGESDAIVKKPGDILYSGSYVVSGKCAARVDKIGKDNYIEQLTAQAKKYKKPKSDLFLSLTWIIRVMAFIIIPIGGLLFYIMFIKNNLELEYSIRKTAGAMVGMIPSGLFLMTSIALAVGVIRLAQRNVLVQELYCIEMLARVNCICLDKTGTITDGTMSVKNVIDYNTIHGLATKNIISAMLNALQDNNLTSVALIEKFGLGKRIKHVAAIPFSSQRKYQAVTFDKFGTFILGAPEFVLKEKFNTIKKDVDKYASLGYRVLCLAHREGIITDGQLPSNPIEVVSMILIEDNIRPDAINTIKYFKDSGVSVRVISGDNPLTVSKISQRAGIEGAEDYVSLDGMADSEVIKAALKYTVFGRVSPAQKRLLVETLKENGMTVAMTGDGVNDILALKEADCSIAVASGSEAARNVSHLVLLDSNFDSMPKVVAEGRRVINNITSVASLFLTKTIFSLFLAIQALQTGIYPISTNQLILIDTLAIGLPSLVLIMEPNNNKIEGKFLANVIKKALPGAITILIISIVVFGLANPLGLDSTSISTIIVIAATHTCLMVLFKTCKPFNTLRRSLCTLCYSLFLFFVVFMPQFLEFRPIFKFTEYYSDDLQTKVISSYPDVQVSKENYYVFNGVVTPYTRNPYETTSSSIKAYQKNDKFYYMIGSTQTEYEIVIPNLSFDDYGNIYLGGYEISDFRYSDIYSYNQVEEAETFTRSANLAVDKNGFITYVNGEDVRPVNTILPKDKNNTYYNYKVNYGKNNENPLYQYKIIPTVDMKDGELYINGKTGEIVELANGRTEEYRYKLQEVITSFSEATITINPNTLDLLVNDKTINIVKSDGEIISTYKVNMPNATLNGDKLYFDAIPTGYNIFEIFGTKEDNVYTLVDDTTGKVITYHIDEDNEYFKVDDVAISNNERYFDINNSTIEGFKDATGTPIDLSALTVSPAANSTTYHLNYNSNQYPSLGATNEKEAAKGVSLEAVTIGPEVKVTVSGMYIIDGYYTEFESAGADLNPRVDEANNLVLGEVATDYKISSNDIIIQKGGMVRPLTTVGKIFLLMLCLLSAPVMKILQGLIPWIRKQIKFIQTLLSKF